MRARPCPFSAFSGTFNFNPYRNSRKTETRFCIICIMRSMKAECLEYQRVTHIRVPVGNRYCTLGFPGDQGTPFSYKSHMLKRLQLIPRIQWVAWRTVPAIGARADAGAVPHGNIPFPLQHGGRSYRFRRMWVDRETLLHTDSVA